MDVDAVVSELVNDILDVEVLLMVVDADVLIRFVEVSVLLMDVDDWKLVEAEVIVEVLDVLPLFWLLLVVGVVAADAVDLEVAEVVDKVLDVLPLFWLLLGVRVVAADTVELEVAERELPDEATVLSVVARELPVCARLVSEPPVAEDSRIVEAVET